MLNGLLQNKAAPGAKAAAAKLPTIAEARENEGDVKRAIATLEADLRHVNLDIEGSYSTGNVAHIATLRARRDTLYQQQAGLAQDLTMAQETLKAAEEREGGKALEAELAFLQAKYRQAAPRADAALEGMAEVYRALLALNGEHLALARKLDSHRRRFNTAPADFLSSDVLRLPTDYMFTFERAVKTATNIAQHRDFLGDAKTEAQATWRRESAWYKEDRERRQRITQKILDKAAGQRPNETTRIYGRRPGAAA